MGWTGSRPALSGSYTYAHEAVLDGKKLEVPPIKDKTKLRGTLIENPLDKKMRNLIGEMLALNYEERPNINQVHQRLKDIYNNSDSDGRSKLIINMKSKL